MGAHDYGLTLGLSLPCMMVVVCCVTVAIAQFWVISRPNSRASFAAIFGMEPPLDEDTVMIDLVFGKSEFSDILVMFLVEAAILPQKLLGPCESCLLRRLVRSSLIALWLLPAYSCRFARSACGFILLSLRAKILKELPTGFGGASLLN